MNQTFLIPDFTMKYTYRTLAEFNRPNTEQLSVIRLEKIRKGCDVVREGAVVKKTNYPRTRSSIAEDLRRLGMKPGMDVLVHSSLSSLGWVNGGSVAVIQALMDVVAPAGTLVMPTHSAEYSDPAKWGNPAV